MKMIVAFTALLLLGCYNENISEDHALSEAQLRLMSTHGSDLFVTVSCIDRKGDIMISCDLQNTDPRLKPFEEIWTRPEMKQWSSVEFKKWKMTEDDKLQLRDAFRKCKVLKRVFVDKTVAPSLADMRILHGESEILQIDFKRDESNEAVLVLFPYLKRSADRNAFLISCENQLKACARQIVANHKSQ